MMLYAYGNAIVESMIQIMMPYVYGNVIANGIP